MKHARLISLVKYFIMLGCREKFILRILFLIFLIFTLQAASHPIADSKDPNQPAIYRRYVRRRPPVYADDEFMEEVFEEFFVQHKPPKYAMSDNDIDLIIKCDSNPEYKECSKLKSKDENPMSINLVTKKPSHSAPPLTEIPLLPKIPFDETNKYEEVTIEYPRSFDTPSTTESEPNFSEENDGDFGEPGEVGQEEEEYYNY